MNLINILKEINHLIRKEDERHYSRNTELENAYTVIFQLNTTCLKCEGEGKSH